MATQNGTDMSEGTSMKTLLRNIPAMKGPFPSLDLDALPDTPQETFSLWLNDAIHAGVKEPHSMTLSTTDDNGWPDARVLILKNVDTRGWHFAIKSTSPKGEQITQNPHVALTFYWPQLGRQVRLRGKAVELSSDECAQDFLDRPVASRVSAMASKQSEVLTKSDDIHRRLEEAQAILENNPEHVVSGWRVYAVSPDNVEFWQGSSDRLHRRLRYARSKGSRTWQKEKLWP